MYNVSLQQETANQQFFLSMVITLSAVLKSSLSNVKFQFWTYMFLITILRNVPF